MSKKNFLCLVLTICILLVLSGCGVEKNSGETINGTFQNMTGDPSEKTNGESEDNELDVTDADQDANMSTSMSNTVSSTTATNKTTNTNTDSTTATGNMSIESTTQKMKDDIFTVTFKDYDGTVLKTEKVKKGASATAPENPERERYRFVKWNVSYDNVKVDIVTTATYEKIVLPTIIVKDVSCSAGDTVIVRVSVMNNPGILGMLMNISYDESVMNLKKIENGETMSDYMFIPPKNTKTGCNAAWSITDIPENVQDGEIMELHFAVDKKASKGVYPVSVSCLNNVFDDNYNSITFEIIEGSVTIK